MRVLSWNILNGGADGGDTTRWRTQAELVGELAPDVLLVQEARGFDADGGRGLHAAEAQLGLRGLLAPAPRTGQHTAVFCAPHLQVSSFTPDTQHFHHALALVTVAVPGLTAPLQLASMHLSPLSPALRCAEVGWLAALAAPGAFALLAGDTNSVAPGDPEPRDWPSLPAHLRVRYTHPSTGPGPITADRSALHFLHAAGLVDAARADDDTVDTTATVPTRGYPDAEFVSFRSDHVLLSPALAPARTGYRVITDDRAHATSDHLPVLVELDLDRLATMSAPT